MIAATLIAIMTGCLIGCLAVAGGRVVYERRAEAREGSRVQAATLGRMFERRHHTDGRTDQEKLDQRAHEEFTAAWLAPNLDFIRETDRILNDIEWERLTPFERDARTRATIEAKCAQSSGQWSTGRIDANKIRVGHIHPPPMTLTAEGASKGEPYSFGTHDQGEAVFG